MRNKQIVKVIFFITLLLSLYIMSYASPAYEQSFKDFSLKDLDRIIFDPNHQFETARIEALKEAHRRLGPKELEERIKGEDHYLSIIYRDRKEFVRENTLNLYRSILCQKTFAE